MVPDELYYQFLALMPLCCVDVAIVQGGAVLLVKRACAPAKGQWWLPGGRVLKGETLRQAAHRKAVGETGLDCHVGPLIHSAETLFDDGPGDISVHSVNSCFLLWPKEGGQKVQLDGQSIDFNWVCDPQEFYELTEEGAEKVRLHPYVMACLHGTGL